MNIIPQNNTTSTTTSTDTAASNSHSPLTIDQTADTQETNPAAQSNDDTTVTLSSEAQQLQKLREEFFSSGPIRFSDISALVQRLEEYGFINEAEAQSLNTGGRGGRPIEGNTSELDRINDFIEQLSGELRADTPDSPLIDTLEQANELIDNFDSLQSPQRSADIKTTLAELSQFLESDAANSLEDDNLSRLEQLQQALRIADRLQPGDLSSQDLNRYLSLANRS